MRVEEKIVVVTGAGNGIGKGLAERFVHEGARAVVISDRDEGLMAAVAGALGQPAVGCDVGDAHALETLIGDGRGRDRSHRPVRLQRRLRLHRRRGRAWCRAALRARDLRSGWDASWQINVMAHVRAARQLVPLMLERGGGYFLNTVSAAGLITSNSQLAYTVTKHADIGFAEWLALNYGTRGIGVSCLCPTAVETLPGQFARMPEIGLVLTPAEVAQYVVDGLDAETFLILPNPAVGGSFRKKAADYDAWIARTQQRLDAMGALGR